MDRTAHTLGAFRECEHGIAYRAVMEWTGPDAVSAVLAAADREGYWCALHDDGPHTHCFAVLDIVDEQDDVIGDRCIPTAEVWAWWRSAVELRATSSDCRVYEPAAYAATYAAV